MVPASLYSTKTWNMNMHRLRLMLATKITASSEELTGRKELSKTLNALVRAVVIKAQTEVDRRVIVKAWTS